MKTGDSRTSTGDPAGHPQPCRDISPDAAPALTDTTMLSTGPAEVMSMSAMAESLDTLSGGILDAGFGQHVLESSSPNSDCR